MIFSCVLNCLIYQFEFTRPPGLVDLWLQRSVRTEDDEPAFARQVAKTRVGADKGFMILVLD